MWLLQLVLIIAACHVCGYVAERVGQCRVVGEISAGIVLGPSVLGAVLPEFHTTMFASAATAGMSQLGEIGLVLLMFEIGLHMQSGGNRNNSGYLKRAPISAKLPALVAVFGLLLPFALGVIVAFCSKSTLAPAQAATPYLLFCGVALAVSAVPVMARIVVDLKLARHPLATAAMSAAMLTDIAGWLMLAAIASIAGAEHGGDGAAGLLRPLASIVLYALGCIAGVRYLVKPWLMRAAARQDTQAVFTLVTCCVLLSAWTTSHLGFHSAFGALLPGILLRDVDVVREQWERTLGGFVRIVLMPVFFSYAGLHTSIASVDGYDAWLWFGAFLVAGFAGKYGGAYLASRVCGLPSNDASVIASLMNARGLMELIVLSIGLQLGILPTRVYTILVLFALVTTAMTTPLVRHHLRHHFRAAHAPLPDPQR
ncbi:cation:proton antiporter [Paraburkholderia sp.]|uniref:cation:proton antiporter n=1 Tax=Paraburkholderia sp. TaxID=1926495 RepID=UPI0023907A6E|nr:cation:proton antiporter [Paraburkholderia sp.]MDE1180637.1 cation:proton antiporter [Paraburkholderia sp.]